MDFVYVKLQPYWQHSISQRICHKLAPKFSGPFPIITRVGGMAYRLQLPPTSRTHFVFHISQLRQHIGQWPSQATLPDIDDQGLLATELVAVLERRLGKMGHKAVIYVLIQWSTRSKEDATWELYSDIERRLPHLLSSMRASHLDGGANLIQAYGRNRCRPRELL